MNERTSDDLGAEIDAALQGVNLQDMASTSDEAARKSARDRNLKRGTIVGITGKDVFVELGPRMQGVVSTAEFEPPPQVGQVYDFTLRGQEDGLWLLSRQEALAISSWDELEVGALVKAKVTGQNTGGLELKIGAASAFMPASHASLGHVEDLSSLLGQHMVCQVLEVDRGKKRVVLSRRAVLERERETSRSQAAQTLSAGDQVRGKVRRIESFGAFVEIMSGLEGLVHVSNMSRKRVEDPNELLKVGDTVDAVVLDIKEGGRRIGLSMKALEPDPWDGLAERLREDSTVTGKVVRLMEFGAFVEIEPGIEGLLHVSQLGKERVRRVQDAVKVGDELSLRVLSVDPHAHRISLSRLDPDGAVIGSEDAADTTAVRDVMSQTQAPLGTNLGDLFKKALKK